MWNLIAGSFTNSVLFRSFVIRYCTMKSTTFTLGVFEVFCIKTNGSRTITYDSNVIGSLITKDDSGWSALVGYLKSTADTTITVS